MGKSETSAFSGNLLIAGCGNMAGAMLQGWLRAGLAANRFAVYRGRFAQPPAGVRLLAELPRDEQFDAVLLGFKPQQLPDAAPPIEPLAGPDTVVLSLLAGVDLATLAAAFPQAKGVVRVMPNLAAALGKSPVALAASGGGAGVHALVDALVAPLGQGEWLDDEALFDAVTALAGSGPAFVYRFIDALSAGAAALGVPRGQADRLAMAMVEGASALAAASPHDPGELARQVASPGGVTQAGLDALDSADRLRILIADTLRAARDRSAAMREEAKNR